MFSVQKMSCATRQKLGNFQDGQTANSIVYNKDARLCCMSDIGLEVSIVS